MVSRLVLEDLREWAGVLRHRRECRYAVVVSDFNIIVYDYISTYFTETVDNDREKERERET